MLSGKYVQFVEPIGPFDGTNADIFVQTLPTVCKMEGDTLMYDDVGRWSPLPTGAIMTKMGGIFIRGEDFLKQFILVEPLSDEERS
ncbi:hypothetical protein [Citrobacter amalonaticus]|uniref:hypothetical protein n=1 Tax=Citrobacter amalonaticus TaxID=35703 RepID=UPI001A1F543F|nr:hypothetical protein [Citrobacter amalonaticus]HDQ2810248.1 hypothetical protein [Citrobacter amalonaticus]